MFDIIALAGDGAVHTAIEGDLAARLPLDARLILCTSDAGTVEVAMKYADRDPRRMSVVEFRRPAVASERWRRHPLISEEDRDLCFDDPSVYMGPEGAGSVTRADAAIRIALSPFERVLRGAVKGAIAARPGEVRPVVRILVVPSSYRNTGSAFGSIGASVATRIALSYSPYAEVHIVVLQLAPSIIVDESAMAVGIIARCAALSEIAVGQLGHGVGGALPPPQPVAVLEAGGPPPGSGVLADELEARRASAQLLSTLVSENISRAFLALLPRIGDICHTPDLDTGTRPFLTGIGACEIVFDEEDVVDFGVAHVLSKLDDALISGS